MGDIPKFWESSEIWADHIHHGLPITWVPNGVWVKARIVAGRVHNHSLTTPHLDKYDDEGIDTHVHVSGT